MLDRDDKGNIVEVGKVVSCSEYISKDGEANKQKIYTITEKNGYKFAYILFAMLITLVQRLDLSCHKNAITT